LSPAFFVFLLIVLLSDQIYRKAALNFVQDLGEDAFPEPPAATSASITETPTPAKTVEPPSTTSEAAAAETPTSTPKLDETTGTGDRKVITIVNRECVDWTDLALAALFRHGYIDRTTCNRMATFYKANQKAASHRLPVGGLQLPRWPN